jgi:hypothetical protein
MRKIRRTTAIVLGLMLTGALTAGTALGGGVVASASGGGGYALLGTLPASFSFNAIAHANGSAMGRFFHSVEFQGQLVEFEGRVTCVTIDAENHRAWIGGVVTANNSEHVGFLSERHEVGADIWFRVVDYGEGADAEPDRSTFVGFEGDAGFITSQDYCDGQPWPDGDDRTWPLNFGNLKVHD